MNQQLAKLTGWRDRVVLRRRYGDRGVIVATITKRTPDAIYLEHHRGEPSMPVVKLKYDPATGSCVEQRGYAFPGFDIEWDDRDLWALADPSEVDISRAKTVETLRGQMRWLHEVLEGAAPQTDFDDDELRTFVDLAEEWRDKAAALIRSPGQT